MINIEEILVANITSIVLLLILLMCRYKTRKSMNLSDQLFSYIVIITILGSFLEPITFLLDGQGHTFIRILNIILNSIEYSCSTTIAIIWVCYVYLNLYNNEKCSNIFHKLFLSIYVFLILLLPINIFKGFLFSIDKNNIYSRQPLGYIYYVFFISCFFYSIIIYYRFRKIYGHAKFFPIWMFLTPIFIAIIFSIIFYGISLSFLSCSVGLTSLYMNIQSKMLLVDTLTGLYNRGYIEHFMIEARECKKYIYSGIMLDVDHFKHINDNLGHSVGDNALVDVANILISATSKNETIFRYAGDEFIVLIKVPISKSETLESKTQNINTA